MTATEIAINDLTVQTTALLAAASVTKSSIEAQISAAVIVSQNRAQIPLITMATNMINTQTIIITHIT